MHGRATVASHEPGALRVAQQLDKPRRQVLHRPGREEVSVPAVGDEQRQRVGIGQQDRLAGGHRLQVWRCLQLGGARVAVHVGRFVGAREIMVGDEAAEMHVGPRSPQHRPSDDRRCGGGGLRLGGASRPVGMCTGCGGRETYDTSHRDERCRAVGDADRGVGGVGARCCPCTEWRPARRAGVRSRVWGRASSSVLAREPSE